MIAFLCHCLTATLETVSLVPLPRCSGLCSSIDFGHVISASPDLEDLSKTLADFL